ncbi:radical SAM protein [Candidatus Woesearchaeota archaeon]|nr:radical SAM protein [Candidatus Woesearchaeota archaeon]
MKMKTWFERAIFLSWYCSRGDCKFCYMSTQKSKIKNPRLAKRKKESIFAEAAICKACGWRVEFLSGGYESYDIGELVEITKEIFKITGQKQWLNIGVLKQEELKKFKPYIEGVCGAVECVNPKLHDKLCPSKPISEIISMFKICDEFGLKKSMTIIIGLGETEKDIPLLIDFIRKHKIDKITFYALNPHEGTIFKKGPQTGYYLKWISGTRKAFPKLHIVAGSWVDRLEEIPELLKAGATSITKFPSIKLFSTKFARQIEEGAEKAGRDFSGTMTRLPKIDISRFDEKTGQKIKQYLKQMSKNS